MIASLVGILTIIAFIAMIVAFYEESMIFNGISLLCWFILFATTMGIETYYVISGNMTTSYHQDVGLQGFYLGMIFLTIVMIIVNFSDYSKNRRFRI